MGVVTCFPASLWRFRVVLNNYEPEVVVRIRRVTGFEFRWLRARTSGIGELDYSELISPRREELACSVASNRT